MTGLDGREGPPLPTVGLELSTFSALLLTDASSTNTYHAFVALIRTSYVYSTPYHVPSVTHYSTPVRERSIAINLSVCVCVSVCLSVCPRAYLWNRWTDHNEIVCADPMWSWLDPPRAALRYVMYFGFDG